MGFWGQPFSTKEAKRDTHKGSPKRVSWTVEEAVGAGGKCDQGWGEPAMAGGVMMAIY